MSLVELHMIVPGNQMAEGNHFMQWQLGLVAGAGTFFGPRHQTPNSDPVAWAAMAVTVEEAERIVNDFSASRPVDDTNEDIDEEVALETYQNRTVRMDYLPGEEGPTPYPAPTGIVFSLLDLRQAYGLTLIPEEG